MSAPVYRWQPSTAQIAQQAGLALDEVIRFDHNTSPVRPPWAEDVAAEAARSVNEYPAADYSPLREAAAEVWGVEASQVVPGAGADEIILLLAKAFVDTESRVVVDSPAYPMYRIAALQRGADLIEVQRDDDLAHPTDRIAAEAKTAAVTWLCVPHNPVGDRMSDAAIEKVLSVAGGVVVIDAAYAEFAGDDWGSWVQQHDSLVVLHTMSKAYGLAGIRVGYSLSSPDVATALHAVRPPGSVAAASQALAVAALQDPAWLRANVAAIRAARSDLAGKLVQIGLAVRPSVANFVLARVGDEAQAVMQRLMDRGLVVRAFPADGPLADYLRFTARTSEDHDRLVAALEEELT